MKHERQMTFATALLLGLYLTLPAAASPAGTEPCDVGTWGLQQVLELVLPVHQKPVWRSGARKIVTLRYRRSALGVSVAAVRTLPFSGDTGPATAAQLNGPSSLAFHDGTLYIADSSSSGPGQQRTSAKHGRSAGPRTTSVSLIRIQTHRLLTQDPRRAGVTPTM